MLFQAHRGVSTEYPENTMPAFRAAWEQGYQVIELDPVFTADGQCVVFHDATVNRTCRRADLQVIQEPLKVTELTYEQLLSYDAGVFMGQQFQGTRVPLLSQVLEFAREKDLLVKLDNKFERFTPEQKEAFYAIVEDSGARVGFTCARLETVGEVTKRFPKAEIHYDGPVTEENILAVKAILAENPLTVWLALPSRLTAWVKVPTATPELCQMVRRHAALGLWILETQEQLQQALALNAHIIETTGSIKPMDH